MPRVISGRAGGRLLKAPAGRDTRPTADRTKEAVFSMLGSRLSFDGIRVLDLFAGSGQLGIEALSRGARFAQFVEQDRRAAAVIRANLAACGFEADAAVLQVPARQAIRHLAAEAAAPFDLVLMDPPYAAAAAAWQQTVPALIAYGLLSDGAAVLMEHGGPPDHAEPVTNLKLVKHCQYGAAMVSFFLYYRSNGAAV